MQGILWITLRYFLIQWKLTNDNYYYNIFYIVRPIATSVFTAQGIVINVFFIILAKKKVENLIHVRNVIIINIIVILIECVVVTTEFLFSFDWDLVAIVDQFKVRLELSVLDYIVEPYRRPDT